ncbi:glycosyl hydrolase [Cohnella hashimotonis]|uniref:Glycosyl hydrolase n=1 Tax=Cohnella hashimotonis TaxID=2826895 RepID=A0ABT6T977_9BACL|nr:glycosyl hydrolase [Cohnella hashimotonis]MDI4643380.1 glycosyl hydrolase [Cohnella hashimotonis]
MQNGLYEWLEAYEDPPAKYRPVPLWSINGRHDAEEIREQVALLQEMGMGGGFFHPRPGLVNEYLSEEWFDLFGAALDEAEKRGLQLYIYDENSYPSGFAGGHVSAELPDCLSRSAGQKILERPEPGELPYANAHFLSSPGQPIAVYAFERTSAGGIRLTRRLDGMPSSEWGQHGHSYLIYDWRAAETNGWLGGFAYVDLLRPEVARVFIERTHERYKARFGASFGKTIPAVFTDEPEVSPGNLFQAETAVPFSYWFAAQFADRAGYDLIAHLPLLFQDAEDGTGELRDAKEVRADYYRIMFELWRDNYVIPLGEWCRSNGLAFTGHYLEHQWPIPWVRFSPGIMSLYEYMDWPGIDFLTCGPLSSDGTDALLVTVREAASVSRQLGKARTLCEAFGAGGFDASTQDFKRIGDWLLAHGIDFLNPHLTAASLAGARKRDHPQSFDWRLPWQYELRQLTDYIARAQLALTQGKADRRVLLLHPTRTAYLYPATTSWEAAGHPFEEMVTSYKTLLQRLSDAGIDYDLGDEEIMARHGLIDAAGRWVVGTASYDEVILPAGMESAMRSTVRLLEAYAAAGGSVRVLGDRLPDYVDGRRDDALAALAARRPESFVRTNADALIAAWSADSRRRCGYGLSLAGTSGGDAAIEGTDSVHASDAVEIRGLAVQSRELPEGVRLLFLAYSAPEPLTVKLTLHAPAAMRLDLLRGTAVRTPAAGEAQELTLEQGDSCCYLLLDDAAAFDSIASALPFTPHAERAGPDMDEVPAEADLEGRRDGIAAAAGSDRSLPIRSIFPLDENALMLDYADVTGRHLRMKGMSVYRACPLLYRENGFDGNPWDNAVQYKRRIAERAPSASTEGFEAAFRLAVDVVPARIRLAVEQGSRMRLEVNGLALAPAPSERWMDRAFAVYDLADALSAGENVLKLIAPVFDPLLELEPAYVLGDFSVTPCEAGFRISAGMPTLASGDWTHQGLPFYGGQVEYALEPIAADERSLASNKYVIRPEGLQGAAAHVRVNGCRLPIHMGAAAADVTSLLSPGINRLSVVVSATQQNVWGPHHAGPPARIASPWMWKSGPAEGPPPGRSYSFAACGLSGVRLSVERR